MYKESLALNNWQELKCHKTKSVFNIKKRSDAFTFLQQFKFGDNATQTAANINKT